MLRTLLRTCVLFVVTQQPALSMDRISDQTVLIEQYSQQGRMTLQKRVPGSSAIVTRINALLTRADLKWKRSFVTYAAARVIIRSSSMIVRCFPDKMVVDVGSGTDWSSYRAKIALDCAALVADGETS